MEINHCYPDSGDSSLSSGNHQKHLGSPCAAFCKMSWGVDGRGGDGWAGRETGVGMKWEGGHWERWSYQPPISVQVLYINIPEQ